MNAPLTLLSILALLSNAIMSSYVFFQRRSGVLNRLFGLMMLPIMTLNFFEAILRLTTSPAMAETLSRFCWAGACLIPPCTFVFATAFPRPSARGRADALGAVILFALGACFLALLFGTRLFIDGVDLRYWGYTGHRGSLFWLFTIYYVSSLAFTLLILRRKLNTSENPLERLHVRYLLIALAFPIVLGSVTQLLLPLVHLDVLPLASASTVVMAALISYSIVRYRLMDLSGLFRFTGAYALLIVVLCLVYVAALHVLGRAFLLESGAVVPHLAIAVVLALAIFPLRDLSVFLMEKIAGRYPVDMRKVLDELSGAASKEVRLGRLIALIAETLERNFSVRPVIFFLLGGDGGFIAGRGEDRLVLPGDSPVVRWLRTSNAPASLDELSFRTAPGVAGTFVDTDLMHAVARQMREAPLSFCFPLVTARGMTGVLSLGRRTIDRLFTYEEVELLHSFASQAGIAIENARLYSDLER